MDRARCTLGLAYWSQRFAAAKSWDRILALSRTVNHASDLRPYAQGNDHPLWKRASATDAMMHLGFIGSAVAQAISIVDFTTRNRMTLDSAHYGTDAELRREPERVAPVETPLPMDRRP